MSHWPVMVPRITAIALVLGATAGAARACDTPMPKNVAIAAPAPGLSADQARLLGVWNGAWQSGTSRICATLAVTEIDAKGDAKLLYAYPAYTALHDISTRPINVPASVKEYSGHFDNIRLTFTSDSGATDSFNFYAGNLAGTSVSPRYGTIYGMFVRQ
jgi:hypothetical protein